jgi:hypothetical protein
MLSLIFKIKLLKLIEEVINFSLKSDEFQKLQKLLHQYQENFFGLLDIGDAVKHKKNLKNIESTIKKYES